MCARLHADWLGENECARMTRDAGMVRVCCGMDDTEVLGNLAATGFACVCGDDREDATADSASIAKDCDGEFAARVSRVDGCEAA